MLILPASRLNVDRFMDMATRMSVWIFAFAAGAIALCYLSLVFEKNGSEVKDFLGSKRKAIAIYPYEAIGSGGLTINPRHALGWVSRIADDFFLIAYNGRPDVSSPDAQLLVSFKVSKEQLVIPNAKTVFLKEMAQGKGLAISDEETALWIKPILLDNGTVLVDAGRKLYSGEGGFSEEKGQFYLTPQGGVPSYFNSSQEPFIKELKTAEFYAQDLLVQKYGGNEYASWRNKGIIELVSATQTYACFVSAGEYLAYIDGEWRVVPFDALPSAKPIARVKTLSARAIELEIWDSAGFYPIGWKLGESQKIGRIQLRPEAMPAKARMRNASQVSCALGKRRMILRQGDWLLKTATGWRNLRRLDEVERYLEHRLKGELLIFDGIENEQGRFLMKGHLFDETRTLAQPFSIPIEGEKSPGKTTRKKIATRKG